MVAITIAAAAIAIPIVAGTATAAIAVIVAIEYDELVADQDTGVVETCREIIDEEESNGSR